MKRERSESKLDVFVKNDFNLSLLIAEFTLRLRTAKDESLRHERVREESVCFLIKQRKLAQCQMPEKVYRIVTKQYDNIRW